MSKLKIGIMGASGRMGRMLIEAAMTHPKTELGGAYVRSISSLIGVDAGEFIGIDKSGITLSTLDAAGLGAMIDFSLPEALDDVLDQCVTHKIPLVMGVTGLSDDQEAKLKHAAKHIAIIYAGNYSTGVNLSLNLLATTARVLGLDADVEIIEHHHKHKIDAPSGTALMMARAVAEARGQTLNNTAVYGREGAAKRQAGDIGFHAVRGGEIVGEHTVEFIMDGEIIEITHKAQSRATFATGAVRAALWAADQPAGLYDMQDVLGLK
ncbi:4-hydroxy-tetrahydrodipicolinate reductase [Moraxella catarrhalis]|uniref:4-hydroxy-tetrahydrodipicolinate reductase n=1 Tax=Moraxella catarrhalis TaxID=480 RepID=A0A198UN38_MORCA|nr:4-hydroxy-tetrahydrodipicolinate reductase [Moraxella catarrhalis]OAU96487.1 Dihydrodipicolinate reductase [Moraxella catarrhalis]OAU96657.1 Dihydrodipicolinate reductase [Moraxella catarrhalis]OAV03788.1 Dihydrodipicolinate reductase [Moraxella catarrhalis]